MSTPWSELLTAVRTAGNRAGALHTFAWTRTLLSTRPVEPAQAAYALARGAVGPSVDTASVRELELEVRALGDDARSIAQVLGPALVSLPEESAIVQRALAGIAGASAAAIGAWVPWSVAVDATLLQVCRDAGASWGGERLAKGERERAEELARRVAKSLGLPVVSKHGRETPEQSAERLAALDLERMRTLSQQNQTEQAIRATLPKV